MSNKYKVSYPATNPIDDLSPEDAAAEHEEYLNDLSEIDNSIPPMTDSSVDDFIDNPDYDHKKPFGIDGNFPDMVNPASKTSRWWEIYPELLLLEKDFKDCVPSKDLKGYQMTSTDAFYEAIRLIAKHKIPPPDWLALELQKDSKYWPKRKRVNSKAIGRHLYYSGKIARGLYLKWKNDNQGIKGSDIEKFIRSNISELLKINIGSKTPFDEATKLYKENRKSVNYEKASNIAKKTI